MYKIISLIPSSTEIVCALGLERYLVGRSHECDYPSSVKRLPICTKPKIDVEGSSSEIDKSIKSILKKALSVYEVYIDKLKELKPTHIITQSQCEVCAVSEKDVEWAIYAFTESRPKIISLAPSSLRDIYRDIECVAATFGIEDKGEVFLSSLQERVKNIEISVKNEYRPRIGCIEWIEPLMAAGNWVPELVELAGGTNLFGKAGKHSPWLNLEELCKENPEIIIVMPCGFNIEKTIQEMSALIKRKEWSNLTAVRNKNVYVVDGNQYFNRPGPRIIDSLEILAEIIHPEIFNFGYKNKGWKIFSQMTENVNSRN